MPKAPKRKPDDDSARLRMKISSASSASGSGSAKPRNPVFDDLSVNYPTAEKLEKHLKSLTRPALETLIISGAFPQAASELRHCVYCHKTFHTSANKKAKCAVMHFIEDPKDIGDAYDQMEYRCCGVRYSDVDNDGLDSAADMFPYCYEGRHWEREITTEDEDEAEGSNRADEMVFDDEPREGIRPVWWRMWREYGSTCERSKCKELLRP